MSSDSNGSADNDKMADRETSTALKGASQAFRQPPKVKPKPDLAALNANRDNGALIAASRSWANTAASKQMNRNTPSLRHLMPEAIQSTPSISPGPILKTDDQIRSASVPRQSLQSSENRQQSTAYGEASEPRGARQPPALPAPRRSDKVGQRNNSASADKSEVGTRSSQTKQPLSSTKPTNIQRKSISPGKAESYQIKSMKTAAAHLTDERLANAIVGAHLAVSQSPPKHISPLLSPPRHRTAVQQSHNARSRTTSPRKGPAPMRHTLRSSESSSSEGPGHHYRRPKRHPHKHHEGERKKWRDRLTEEELKRYAGWWAANRGWFVPKICPISKSHSIAQAEIEAAYKPDEEVVDIVVRDLWQRSRLSNLILMAIWELVDERRIGSLNKDQFIVGAWLIDQKLKGHKLPTHIASSVWQSVARMNAVGVKVRVLRYY